MAVLPSIATRRPNWSDPPASLAVSFALRMNGSMVIGYTAARSSTRMEKPPSLRASSAGSSRPVES